RVVNRALAVGKPAVDRDRATQVRIVVRVFRTEIHQDDLAVPAFAVIFGIMQHAGVGAGGNDRMIRVPAGPSADELVNDLRFNLVFLHTGLYKPKDPAEGSFGNFARFAY